MKHVLADKPSGLKWMYVGDQRPTGTEVSLPISGTSSQYLNWEKKLAQTLRDGTLEFTEEEWDVFEITLPDGGDSFIHLSLSLSQAGAGPQQRYFMPDRYTGPKFRTAGAMQKNPAAVSDADGNIFLLAQVGSDGGASKWDQLKYIKRLEKYSWGGTTVSQIDVSNIGATLFFGATNCSQGLCVFGGGSGGNNGIWRERYGITQDIVDSDGIPELIYYNQDLQWQMKKSNLEKKGIRNRYGHSMVSTDSRIYIFGGTHGNIDNSYSSSDASLGPWKSATENRMDVAWMCQINACDPTTPFYDDNNTFNNANMGIRTALNDLWECNVEREACKLIASPGPAGRSFFGFTAIYATSKWTLVLFGGMGTARNTEFSDSWEFDVPPGSGANF